MNKAKRFYQQILLTSGANFCRYRIFIDRKLSEHLLFLKAKNKPLQNLLSKRSTKKNKKKKISVPVVNLRNNYLTQKKRVQLSFGVENSFMDKNRYIIKNLTANLEVVP